MKQNPPTELHCTLCAWFATVTTARWAGIAPDGQTHYLCGGHKAAHGYRYTSTWIMTKREIQNRLSGHDPFSKDVR